MGGCCAPNRYKPTDNVFRDDGDSFEETGDKIVAISDSPLVQTIVVHGAYMQYMTDDHAMVNGHTHIHIFTLPFSMYLRF